MHNCTSAFAFYVVCLENLDVILIFFIAQFLKLLS